MRVSMNYIFIGNTDNTYRNRIFRKRLNHNSSQTTKLTMLFHSDNSSGFFCRLIASHQQAFMEDISNTRLNAFLL